jgi:exopolyphosphatase/guanosine-5'-triphosphate,3'-diphosphate pyrophosphatase
VEPSAAEAVAALDCGTNSTRLLIVSDGPAVRRMRITRLGQGVDATGKLDAEAVERTLDALTEYRRLMDANDVTRSRLVATSAVRDAGNGGEFLVAASRIVGTPAELLDGEAEGSLAFAGATAALELDPARVAVIDIGGGSTELVVGDGRVRAVSLDLGCVRVTERFFAHDPPTADELGAAARFIRAELDKAAGQLPELTRGGRTLVGLAGTVTTLGALAQGLSHYDRARIHHFVLSFAEVSAWLETLAIEPAAERAKRPGMAPGREDVIAGGVLVLRETMDRFSFDRCIVSEADLLDGIAATLRTA